MPLVRHPMRLLFWTLPVAVLAASLPARALVAGDLMFTSFNADDDGWSLAVLHEMAPNTTVFFSDNAWNAATGGFVGGESFHRWNSGPTLITTGTVVLFSKIDNAALLTATVGTLSREPVPGNTNYGLSQTAETVYAYQGLSAAVPQVFITAMSSDGFSSATGGLAGTGLVAGATAVVLANGTDYAEYNGVRAGLTAEQFRARLANASSWANLGDGNFALQSSNVNPLAVVAIPEPAGVWLGMVGVLMLATFRRTAKAW